MDLGAAAALARKLIAQHVPSYGFEFTNHKTALGICNYRRCIIGLSRVLTPIQTEAEVLDTILHEIAHAKCPGAGHNRVWKMTCRALGGSGRVTARIPNDAEHFNYHLMYGDEIVNSYVRKPRRDFSKLMIRGRRDTLGKLRVTPASQLKKA